VFAVQFRYAIIIIRLSFNYLYTQLVDYYIISFLRIIDRTNHRTSPFTTKETILLHDIAAILFYKTIHSLYKGRDKRSQLLQSF